MAFGDGQLGDTLILKANQVAFAITVINPGNDSRAGQSKLVSGDSTVSTGATFGVAGLSSYLPEHLPQQKTVQQLCRPPVRESVWRIG